MSKYENIKARLNPDKLYELEELAAIKEFSGGMSREQAEGQAATEFLKK